MEDLGALALLVVIGVVIIAGGYVASLLRIPAPLAVLVLGVGVGFIPAMREFALPPELVLLLFLPPLLYWESLNTSLREIRSNLRVILLLSIGLVLVTAAVVAVIAHAFGLPWPVAIALGAILAPTDATAVAAIASRLPRRALTILRAESLINDGTALVIYAIAVGAAVSGEPIQPLAATWQFFVAYAGAILIGAATIVVVLGLRRIIRTNPLVNVVSVLTPYLAYLPAEALGVSGVVAVVVAGLGLWQFGLRGVEASARVEAFAFWRVTAYILNAILFALVGIQAHNVADDLAGGWQPTILLGLCAVAAVIGTRLLYANITPYIIRALDRRPAQRARRVPFRQRFPIAWAGFRGAVSLAAALALPTETAAGDPFPYRDAIIAVTFIVILVTLLVQGLTMPWVVRWADLPDDVAQYDEQLLAEQTIAQAALDALDTEATRLNSPEEVRDQVHTDIQRGLDRIHRSDDDPAAARRDVDGVQPDTDLRMALLPIKRKALIDLRNEQRIDDIVLRTVQNRLDIEELRLRAVEGQDG